MQPYHFIIFGINRRCPLRKIMNNRDCWNVYRFSCLISIKSVICQVDTNCSPFQSLSMISFHIRLERLKLTYYSLISNFSRYLFKTANGKNITEHKPIKHYFVMSRKWLPCSFKQSLRELQQGILPLKV